MIRNRILSTFLFFAMLGFGGQSLHAQLLKVGGAVGALGASGTDGSTNLGYGAYLGFVPYDTLGLLVDATFSENYFSSSPSLVFYFPTYEELRIGGIAGGGFYKFSGSDLRFGLDAGLLGDFMLSENIFVGAQFRYHAIFDSVDVWNVFLTLSFNFSTGDGW